LRELRTGGSRWVRLSRDPGQGPFCAIRAGRFGREDYRSTAALLPPACSMLVESQFLTARQLSELATNPRDHSDED